MIFISVILILTGQIDQNTPVLGVIFGDLSVSINEILNQRYSDDIIVNLLTVVISLLVAVGTLSTNLRRIALSDIKNPELKKMLIRAGLYFNKDGKLVKKIEIATRMDLDGDNKIGDDDIHEIPRERFVPSLRRSVEELGTILTIKIESEAEVEQIKKDNDLLRTEEAIKAIAPVAIQSAREVTTEQILLNSEEVTEEKRNLFKAGLNLIGAGILAGAVFVRNTTVKAAVGTGRFVKSSAIVIGVFFKNIGLAIGGFFKKLFTKKEKPLKVKKEKVVKLKEARQPKPVKEKIVAQPKQQPVSTPVDPLEALRKKYGK
jgi:hypothetical protein